MKIDTNLTDDALLSVLGERIARLRLARNLTQQQLAEQTGLGLRTIQRLELGVAATQLSGFVRVCRVLGLIERFDVLIPDEAASPMAQLKQRKAHKRQRATRRKAATAGAPEKWTWGDPA